MNIEDLECIVDNCTKPLLGRAVVVVPGEGAELENQPLIMHPECYLKFFDQLFKQETTTIYEMYVASIHDIWAGLYTDSDEEAGIPEG